MATARHARIEAIETLHAETRVLHVSADEPLGFVGGQYVIVDSGLRRADGKAVKRAYSIFSADDEQLRFALAVKRLSGGPGSSFMHALEPGGELRFSGPWGKLVPPADARGSALVFATDTGVTAALGLLRGARFRPLLADTRLVWLRDCADSFLPDGFVRDMLPAGLASVLIAALPAIGHPERVAVARGVAAEALARQKPAHAFVAGDGVVNYALLDDLIVAGVNATRDSLESFFNMPKKS
jgi:ferredoxin-NADP reductase